MMKSFKPIIAIILSVLMIFALPIDSISTIYEQRTSESISNGVNYYNIRRLTSAGWLNISVVEINLNTPHIHVDTLSPKDGVSTRENVLSMALDRDFLAAINGDFYVINEHASSLNLLIRDGELLTSPMNPLYTSAFYMKDYPLIGSFTPRLTIRSLSNGQERSIAYYNKETNNYDGIALYDNKYGPLPNAEVHRYLVQGTVLLRRLALREEYILRDNEYMLYATGDGATFLSNIREGSDVLIRLGMDPTIDGITAAIGGGATLVREGKVAMPFNHDISGRHPRSAIGYNKDKSKLYLVAVDGRSDYSIGMTQEELALLLIELGCYDAINLDGGGSTTLVYNSEGTLRVGNRPSDGTLRRVANAIGVYSSAPVGSLARLVVRPDQSELFKDTPLGFKVLGFDIYGNPLGELKDYKLEVLGVPHSISNDQIIPSSSGAMMIKVSYGSISSSALVNILDKPIALEGPSYVSLLRGEAKELNIYGYDKNGLKAKIPVESISFDYSPVVAVSGKNIRGISNGNTPVKASFAGATVEFGAYVGELTIDLFGFEGSGLRFLSYPTDVKGSLSYNSQLRTEGSQSLALSYNFSEHDVTRAVYAVFDEPLILDELSVGISLMLYGNGLGNQLKANITDANGSSHLITLRENIDFYGFRKVEADISGLALPAKLNRIYVVETKPDNRSIGTLYIDELKVSKRPANLSRTEITDYRHSELAKDGFAIGGSFVGLDTPFTRIANKTRASLNSKFEDKLTREVVDGLTLIKVPYTLEGERFVEFIDSVKAVNTKGLILYLKTPLSRHSAPNRELILSLCKGLDLVILDFGLEHSFEFVDGARHITLKDYNLSDPSSDNLDLYQRVSFKLIDGNIHYFIRSLF